MRHLHHFHLAAAAFAVVAMSPLNAATLITNDRGEWLANVSNLVSLNFDSYSGGNSGGFTVGGVLQPGNQTFYNSMNGYFNNSFQVVGQQNANFFLMQLMPSGTQPWFNWGSGALLFSDTKSTNNTISMRVTFRSGGTATPVNAFGFALGLGGEGGTSGTVTVTPQGLGAQTVTTFNQASGLRFFGVTSSTQTFGFADITISTVNRYIVLDSVEQGVFTAPAAPPPPPDPSEVPDAATLFCVGSGLAYLGYLRRSRAVEAA